MLEKDPKNTFDPCAIRVRRLDGEDLGFVPKELTECFPHDVTFGHIHHVGQVPINGLWGALVRALLLSQSNSVRCTDCVLHMLLRCLGDWSDALWVHSATRSLLALFDSPQWLS